MAPQGVESAQGLVLGPMVQAVREPVPANPLRAAQGCEQAWPEHESGLVCASVAEHDEGVALARAWEREGVSGCPFS